MVTIISPHSSPLVLLFFSPIIYIKGWQPKALRPDLDFRAHRSSPWSWKASEAFSSRRSWWYLAEGITGTVVRWWGNGSSVSQILVPAQIGPTLGHSVQMPQKVVDWCSVLLSWLEAEIKYPLSFEIYLNYFESLPHPHCIVISFLFFFSFYLYV